LVAYILDAVIVGGVVFVLALPLIMWWFISFMSEMTHFESSYDPQRPSVTGPDIGRFFAGYFLLIGAMVLLALTISYFYFVEMAWKSGQSIGKRVVKLQIVPVDPAGARSRGMFVKRWAVERVTAVFVPFFSYLDGLWQLWDKPFQQCLHDKAAQTVVVKIG
jgi:uncharacterized RDD family membrane protein YckC